MNPGKREAIQMLIGTVFGAVGMMWAVKAYQDLLEADLIGAALSILLIVALAVVFAMMLRDTIEFSSHED